MLPRMAATHRTAAPTTPRSRAYDAAREEDAGRHAVRATPATAFRAAVRMFIDEPRLDMGRLAADLGIAKATLYRWTGPRDQLLGDILAYLSDATFERAFQATSRQRGAARVAGCIRRYIEEIVSFDALRRFLQSETQLAMRILTERGSAPQSSAIRNITNLLEVEQERGLALRASVPTLAYAITRMSEGFMYNEAIADFDADVDSAVEVIRLLVD